MNQPPTIRLHLYLAADAQRGVILRQGPTKCFCMIGWDTKTDTFEIGQWLKQKIYTERCDISPDGQYFLYFVLNGRWQSKAKRTHTVISRVPYFTALALYPEGSTWAGGGYFVDKESYHINSIGRSKDLVGKLPGLRRVDGMPAPAPSLFRDLGTRVFQSFSTLPEPDPSPTVLEQIDALMACKEQYHTDGPLLYRKTKDGGLDLIGDFSDMQFESMIAPYEGGVPE